MTHHQLIFSLAWCVGAIAWATPTALERPIVHAVELHLPADAAASDYAPLVSVAVGRPLSPGAVRRTIERLYERGNVADVVVRARQVAPGQVDLVFEVTLKQYLDRLVIAGSSALTEAEILRAVKFRAQEEDSDENKDQIIQRVLDLYRQQGYQETAVEPQVTEEGGERVLSIYITEGEPVRVSGIIAAGDPGMSTEQFEQALGLSIGAVLVRGEVSAAIETLRVRYRKEARYRARVDAPLFTVTGRSALVEVPVESGPIIRFHVHGNVSFPEAELLKRLEYDGEEPLDAATLVRLVGRVVSFYRAKGFYDVSVHTHQYEAPGSDESVIAFHVVEGEQLSVSQIHFEGVNHFSEDELRKVLSETIEAAQPLEPLFSRVLRGDARGVGIARARGDEGSAAPYLPLEGKEVLIESAYGEAERAIVDKYRAAGFLAAAVKATRIDIEEFSRRAAVVVTVDEGIRTLIGEVHVTGTEDDRAMESSLSLKAGAPLSGADVDAARFSLLKELGRRGYAFARVDDEETYGTGNATAKVIFHCTAGPQVHINRILIREDGRPLEDQYRTGVAYTQESVVRDNLLVKEGEVYDPKAIDESQSNLLKLGIFSSAVVQLSNPETEEAVKDVLVDVKERDRFDFSLTPFGYSMVDGVRVRGSASDANVWRGLTATIDGKVSFFDSSWVVITDPTRVINPWYSSFGWLINASLQEARLHTLLPAFPDTDLSVRTDAVFERVHRPYYDFTRAALLLPEISWTNIPDLLKSWLPGLTNRLTVSLQNTIERDLMSTPFDVTAVYGQISLADYQNLLFPNGGTDLDRISATVSLDERDNPATPTKGVYLAGTVELDKSFAGEFDVALLKASLTLDAYRQITKGIVLAASIRTGRIFPETGTQVIAPTRFFLGGAASERGFAEDALVAQDVRQSIHGDVTNCNALATPLGCSVAATALASNNPIPSLGGNIFVSGQFEVRVALTQTVGAAVFFDAGNLWFNVPAKFTDYFDLRTAAGVGLRVPTPVGQVAFDIGFKLDKDAVINETPIEPHLSIGLF
jgi:outer membrane protein insertion porin family